MRLPRILHDDTVTLITSNASLPDANGLPAGTTVETEWPGVNVQRVRAEDLTDEQRSTNRTWYRVAGSLPPVPVTSADQIRWRGTLYEVDGDPDTHSGAGRLEHTALQMVTARG